MMPGTAYCPSCQAPVAVHVDSRAQENHPPLVLSAMVDKQAAGHAPKCEQKYSQRQAPA